ncbi:MAG: rhodanese-like domain-containing protein [Acidimicrobiia bacterium]|nr:rhodanese-like domain-containing protein [Acidimicrobiia bacterium]
MNIVERMEAARERIERVAPEDLAVAEDVLVIDLRCREDRARDGVIPGSVAVPMTVLEWRCDPASPFASPLVATPERRTIVHCTDGYTSSLAADSLRDLGFERAGDLIGGLRAWVAAGLPVASVDDQIEAGYEPPT